ncbi:Uma2 family endonuclease [Streptomyces achromogenes]|uniref:Uma2 family endonuclease n=1 Tax=Streptomyces achromogenes TaxID=67255 RepID=A0ABZ1KRX4_STRAH
MKDHQLIEFFLGLRPPEGARAELLRRTIFITPPPDVVHDENLAAVVDQLPRTRGAPLGNRPVDMLEDVSVPVPDAVVVEHDALAPGSMVPSASVAGVVEVVSRRSVERDYAVKPSIYAAAGVPAYLIVDPLAGLCLLLAEPAGEGEYAGYRWQRGAEFGERMPLEPFGVALDTTGFGRHKNVRPHRYP